MTASIVDPHGLYFEDALPKLRDYREFAVKYDVEFDQIEAVPEAPKGVYMFLDLKSEDFQKAVSDAPRAESLSRGPVAKSYSTKALRRYF